MYQRVSEDDVYAAVKALRTEVGERYDYALDKGFVDRVVPMNETTPMFRSWLVAMFASLGDTFKGKRDLRLSVLGTLVGEDIDSTNDLDPCQVGAITGMGESEPRWLAILDVIGQAPRLWATRLASIPVPERPKVKLETEAPPVVEEQVDFEPALAFWREEEPIPF